MIITHLDQSTYLIMWSPRQRKSHILSLTGRGDVLRWEDVTDRVFSTFRGHQLLSKPLGHLFELLYTRRDPPTVLVTRKDSLVGSELLL